MSSLLHVWRVHHESIIESTIQFMYCFISKLEFEDNRILNKHTANEKLILRFYSYISLNTKQRVTADYFIDEYTTNELCPPVQFLGKSYSYLIHNSKQRFELSYMIAEHATEESFKQSLYTNILLGSEKIFQVDYMISGYTTNEKFKQKICSDILHNSKQRFELIHNWQICGRWIIPNKTLFKYCVESKIKI
jgi:hypothetical protein